MFIKELVKKKFIIKFGNTPKIIVNINKGRNDWNSISFISLENFKWFDKVPKYILLK